MAPPYGDAFADRRHFADETVGQYERRIAERLEFDTSVCDISRCAA
jgi:hypothetical protein